MTLDAFNLSGQSAIVTGASRGLGAGIARGLAAAGAEILVVASSDRVSETKAEIEAAGGRAETFSADLAQPQAPQAVVAAAIAAFGKVDILVNCAGMIRRKPAIDVTEADWDDVIALNQRAVFFLAQAAARDMMKRGRGKIINIASLLSFQGGIIVPSYTASKTAVAGLTRALANEWAPHGINVNAIAPGYMATELTGALQNDASRAQSILSRIPQGRWGTAEDLQGAAIFLASTASDYVQGHTLVVDGGWLSR